MLSKNLEKSINKQINAELWSAYLYLSMSSHFTHEGLPGVAHWFMKQYEEEVEHAMRFMQYMADKGSKVLLAPIEKVDTEWDSLMHAFEETLAHEKVVTGLIHDLMTLAKKENDYATEIMLQWFVTEQVEEEDSVNEILDTLRLIGDKGHAIYKFDKDLGQREDEEEE